MKKLVLVVEDNYPVSDNLREMLEVFGYRSVFASNAKTALDAVYDLHPDLILLDIRLAGESSGIDVARQLRSEYDGTPIIFVSADVSPETTEIVSQLGEVLKKPFGMHELLEVIKEVLDQ